MSTLEQSLALRAHILLLLSDGLTPKVLSEQLQVTPPTVFKWRKRYLEEGVEGLSDLPRSGQPLKLGAEKSTRSSSDYPASTQGGDSLECPPDGQLCAGHHLAGASGLGCFRPQTPSSEDL